MTNRKVLGRGLSELFGGDILSINKTSGDLRYNLPVQNSENQIVELDLGDIIPCPTQPRTVFNDDALEELASSIKENGVLQPIIVRKSGVGYEIIAGERRWRASKLAGKQIIPCLIKDLDNHKAFIISVIENLQRSGLSPLEESEAYNRLVVGGYTHEQVAGMVNKSRSYVSNITRLVNLHSDVKKMLQSESLSLGHAKILLANEISLDEQYNLATDIIEKSLNIRQTEDLIRNFIDSKTHKQTNILSEKNNQSIHKNGNIIRNSDKFSCDNDLFDIAELLKSRFSSDVLITKRQIIIDYKDMKDLDRLLNEIIK